MKNSFKKLDILNVKTVICSLKVVWKMTFQWKLYNTHENKVEKLIFVLKPFS